jgi:hypothetical protein
MTQNNYYNPVATFFQQVATWFLDLFCNFYVVKKRKNVGVG